MSNKDEQWLYKRIAREVDSHGKHFNALQVMQVALQLAGAAASRVGLEDAFRAGLRVMDQEINNELEKNKKQFIIDPAEENQ